jgi:hypothetical protein
MESADPSDAPENWLTSEPSGTIDVSSKADLPDPLPRPNEPVIAHCLEFRCAAYLNAQGKWIGEYSGHELPEVLSWESRENR